MSWVGSLLTGLGLAIAGTLLGGLVASQASRWLRISSREGYSGYWTVFMAILAGLYGLLCGLLVTRYAGIEGSAAAVLGAAAAAAGGISLAGFLAWLARDRTQSFKGRELLIDIEVRSPADSAPIAPEPSALHGYLDASRNDPAALRLDLSHQRQEAGRQVVPGRLALRTRKSGVYLVLTGQRLNQAKVYFRIEAATINALPAGQWTSWLAGSPGGDLQPTSDAAGFELRLRHSAPATA